MSAASSACGFNKIVYVVIEIVIRVVYQNDI